MMRPLLVLASALMLAGCANMAETPAGTPLASVQAQFGKPTMTCPLANGGFRAIWSQQPYGEYAWGADVNAQGDVGVITQVLDDPVFEQLSEGVWDAKRVRCMFGPPAQVDSVGLPSVRKTFWSYRYMQYGVWYSMMNIGFDPQTMIVTTHFPSPDPMFMYDSVLFW